MGNRSNESRNKATSVYERDESGADVLAHCLMWTTARGRTREGLKNSLMIHRPRMFEVVSHAQYVYVV
jgi:hypothetical protein